MRGGAGSLDAQGLHNTLAAVESVLRESRTDPELESLLSASIDIRAGLVSAIRALPTEAAQGTGRRGLPIPFDRQLEPS
jgi:hypothetical protein